MAYEVKGGIDRKQAVAELKNVIRNYSVLSDCLMHTTRKKSQKELFDLYGSSTLLALRRVSGELAKRKGHQDRYVDTVKGAFDTPIALKSRMLDSIGMKSCGLETLSYAVSILGAADSGRPVFYVIKELAAQARASLDKMALPGSEASRAVFRIIHPSAQALVDGIHIYSQFMVREHSVSIVESLGRRG